jgi:hypothetical protein
MMRGIVLAAGLGFILPLGLRAQVLPETALSADRPEAPATSSPQEGPDPSRARFGSFDVGFGGAFPLDGDPGLSYSVAVDAANLFIRGASLRFSFRFWSWEDTSGDGRVVDLDDSSVSVMVKKDFGGQGSSAYGGLGFGLHFVAARFQDLIEEQEARDGFRPSLEAVLGAQISLADSGFITLFLEGLGSLMDRVTHTSAHIGFRIRFDRLGIGG